MKRTQLLVLIMVLIPIGAFSQFEKQKLRKELRKERPVYIGISAGLGISSFRDFATSPLIYTGIPKYISLSRIRMDIKRESKAGLAYSFGTFYNNFNSHSVSSKVNTVSLYYSQLYKLDKLSSQKLNVKIGGLFNANANLRNNESLQNNALGIEIVPTLLGSAKLTTDISRKKSVTKKFLFIKYRSKQRTRNLSFVINMGLINNSYRNGYAYTGQSAVLNEIKIFDDYRFKIFSGFRISSSLDYTVFLKNKNAIQLSYLWDAYKTANELDKFEMAHHTFKFSFLFNTNNR